MTGFGAHGAMRGVLGEDLTPEGMLRLGSALAGEGTVGLGCSNTPGARMLGRAAAVGVAAAGGTAVTHAMECPVQGAWAAAQRGWPISLFVEEGEEAVFLHLFDRQGLHLERERERELETRLADAAVGRAGSREVGELRRAALTARQWAEDTVARLSLGRPALRRVAAAVEGDSPEDQAVREVLLAMGCHLEDAWRPGIPAFRADRGGYRLTVRDERGGLLEPGQVLSLVALIEMENGGAKVAVPPDASAGVDVVAAGYNGTVLRLDRDGQRARDLYAALPWLWSAPAAAGRICARMGVSGQRLESLAAKTPRFHTWRREVPLEGDRSRLLEVLAGEQGGLQRGEGLRLRAGSGWVCLSPARHHILRVVAEDADMETAAELCDFFAGRAADLDRKLLEEDKNQQFSS